MKNNKKKLEQVMLDEIMSIPKVSFVLAGIGFLIILYSFVALSNPFFIVTGTFAGIVFFYWAYSYWYNNLLDKRVENLTKRVDDITLEVFSK